MSWPERLGLVAVALILPAIVAWGYRRWRD
jgi:hypothetical protein